MPTLLKYQPKIVEDRVYGVGPLDPRLVTDSFIGGGGRGAWANNFNRSLLVVKNEQDLALLFRVFSNAASPQRPQVQFQLTEEEKAQPLIRELMEKEVLSVFPQQGRESVSVVVNKDEFSKVFTEGCYIHYTPENRGFQKSIAIVMDRHRNVFYADAQAAACPAPVQAQLKKISTELCNALSPQGPPQNGDDDEEEEANNGGNHPEVSEATLKEVISAQPASYKEGDDVGFTIEYFQQLKQELGNPPQVARRDGGQDQDGRQEEAIKKEKEKAKKDYLDRVAQNMAAITTPKAREEIAQACDKPFLDTQTYQTANRQKWREVGSQVKEAYKTYLEQNKTLTCNFSKHEIISQGDPNKLQWQATNIFSAKTDNEAIHVEGTIEVKPSSCSYTTKITGAEEEINRRMEEAADSFSAFVTVHAEAVLSQYFINRFPPNGAPPANLADDQKVVQVSRLSLSDKDGLETPLSAAEEGRLKQQFQKACEEYFQHNGYAGFTFRYQLPAAPPPPAPNNNNPDGVIRGGLAL